jgi:amino acid permease
LCCHILVILYHRFINLLKIKPVVLRGDVGNVTIFSISHEFKRKRETHKTERACNISKFSFWRSFGIPFLSILFHCNLFQFVFIAPKKPLLFHVLAIVTKINLNLLWNQKWHERQIHTILSSQHWFWFRRQILHLTLSMDVC